VGAASQWPVGNASADQNEPNAVVAPQRGAHGAQVTPMSLFS
jgi:hypothetical protein